MVWISFCCRATRESQPRSLEDARCPKCKQYAGWFGPTTLEDESHDIAAQALTIEDL